MYYKNSSKTPWVVIVLQIPVAKKNRLAVLVGAQANPPAWKKEVANLGLTPIIATPEDMYRLKEYIKQHAAAHVCSSVVM